MNKYVIDPNREIENICDWIKSFFAGNGRFNTKAVIGISGGKDSTVAAALLCRALGPANVIAVLMPNGEQSDIDDSYRVCDVLAIPRENVWNINIANAVKACVDTVGGQNNYIISTNTPARVRMIMLYQIAAMVEGGGFVCNTSNKSEAYIGYCTKYGDLAGDFALLKNYCVREVIEIGLALNLPKDLIVKAPSDGMCGSTDEERLGFTYEELDAYLLENERPEYLKYRFINDMYKASIHKRVIDLKAPNPCSRHREEEVIDDWFEDGSVSF